MSRDTGFNREACGEVPACEVQCSTNNEVWDFCHGLRPNERHPVVSFRLQEAGYVSNASYHYSEVMLTFFSRVSKMSRLCKKKGCIWLIQPGATKMKLKIAKSLS